MNEGAERLLAALALRRSLRSLDRDVMALDRFPWFLALGSFVAYFAVGAAIALFKGFDFFDYFFNGDCPRVVADLTRAQKEASSGYPVSAAHPLFLILLNPIGSALSRGLGGNDLLAALVLCHAAAALANVCFYFVLRRLGVERWLAGAGAIVVALSATRLVLGSIVETYAFVGLALALCVLVSITTSRPERVAFVQVLPFGLNLVLAPFSFLAAPAIWLGRLSPGKWILRVLALWGLLVVIALLLLAVQHDRYPDTNFFHKDAFKFYFAWSSKPAGSQAFFHRWARLFPHLVAFDFVAPIPLFTGGTQKITTFMWDGNDRLAHYSPLGWVTAGIWVALVVLGTTGNVQGLLRGERDRLGTRLLAMGWLAGVFGLFTFFGDDLLLYSEMWLGIVALWVFLGLDRFATGRFALRLKIAALLLVVGLSIDDVDFVTRMVRFY